MFIHDRIESYDTSQIDNERNEYPLYVSRSEWFPLSVDDCFDIFQLENWRFRILMSQIVDKLTSSFAS